MRGVRFVKTHFQPLREEDDPSGTPDTPDISTSITICATTVVNFFPLAFVAVRASRGGKKTGDAEISGGRSRQN